MIFHGKVYDILKQIAMIWLPALGVFYITIAAIWHIPKVEAVSGTILAVDTLLGGLLGISSSVYNNSDAKYDGTLRVEPNEDGGQNIRLFNVPPYALNNKSEVRFKIDDSALSTPPPPTAIVEHPA